MKMNNKQKTPLSILADREVFDYLKEKVGERKTRTEAYCDLLDKALSGFVSPLFTQAGLRAATQPVPRYRFRPRIGVALAQSHCPFLFRYD